MIKEFVDIGFNVFDRLNKWKQLEKDGHAKTRLLYLECRRNLALIDCMKLGDQNENGSAADLLNTAGLLETEILEMIFMDSEKGNKFFELLSKSVAQKNDDGNDEVTGDPDGIKIKGKGKKSIIEAAMFAYIRISLIKKLSSLTPNSSILDNINLKTRLKNIRNAILSIVKKLHEEDIIKKMEGLRI